MASGCRQRLECLTSQKSGDNFVHSARFSAGLGLRLPRVGRTASRRDGFGLIGKPTIALALVDANATPMGRPGGVIDAPYAPCAGAFNGLPRW